MTPPCSSVPSKFWLVQCRVEFLWSALFLYRYRSVKAASVKICIHIQSNIYDGPKTYLGSVVIFVVMPE